jgi:hypothetical protein
MIGAYQANKVPTKYEMATFMPTRIPEPRNAGVHSINHPQLSNEIAKLGDIPVRNNHVKGCQS